MEKRSHLKRPSASCLLPPKVDGEERPLVESGTRLVVKSSVFKFHHLEPRVSLGLGKSRVDLVPDGEVSTNIKLPRGTYVRDTLLWSLSLLYVEDGQYGSVIEVPSRSTYMYLALYVLEVIDSVDGSRASVTCHTDPGSSSNVVGDLSGWSCHSFSLADFYWEQPACPSS